jgi:hypothetical protein
VDDPAYNIIFDTPVNGVSSSVPEPATWTMMLLAFVGLGFAEYRPGDKKI